ncbi:peptidoglycan bridge formation glycyltransferase FemA/FemB family protein [Candidatus Saccharibacteria bacterium]|jgi:lipid II:glycine glycyltransferase (peptidoglycan interpeptide bridge formation enzyme)|nr:peptidoglycan bridge formation glycyltransferase FemA/FemB family protein [Candidatus Saccharibacteria bacterium]
MKTHFLQSKAWQTFQEAMGRTVYFREGEGWQYRAILEPGTRLAPARLYCPYGPTAINQRALNTALESLKALAASTDATFVRVQPLGVESGEFSHEKLGLKQIEYSQPADTWCIDLTQDEETIIANMKQSNRNIYRNYHKKGLSYRSSVDSDEISHLLRLIKQTAERNNISAHSDNYLVTQAKSLIPIGAATLHFIEHEGKIIAAALTYNTDETTYYAHASADFKHRKLGASTALVAEIILRAKKNGRKTCDLYGITTSEDSQHPWVGFTKFKKSFGGYHIPLSHTYDLPIKSGLYRTYSLAKRSRALSQKLRKLL